MVDDALNEPEELYPESEFQRALVKVLDAIAGGSPHVTIQSFGVDLAMFRCDRVSSEHCAVAPFGLALRGFAGTDSFEVRFGRRLKTGGRAFEVRDVAQCKGATSVL